MPAVLAYRPCLPTYPCTAAAAAPANARGRAVAPGVCSLPPALHPCPPQLNVPLKPLKDVAVVLMIKVGGEAGQGWAGLAPHATRRRCSSQARVPSLGRYGLTGEQRHHQPACPHTTTALALSLRCWWAAAPPPPSTCSSWRLSCPSSPCTRQWRRGPSRSRSRASPSGGP